MIQAVLQEAARRPVTDKPVKLLLEKLQDVAYNADDVLDDFAYEILRKDQKKGKVCDCFSLHNPIAFHLSMGQKIKEINGSLDEIQILAPRCGLGLIAPQHANGAPEISLDRQTESSSEIVVGRDGDVFKILNLLTGSIDQQVLSVVPIVGMAGLGKTAIAKKICQLAREKKHFDVTLWVCASNDFNKGRILGEMLQKIDKYTGGLSNLDAIIEKLQQELENKTFLLVLDDVWNEDHDMWDDLKDLLLKINKKNGNVVVVTTRSTKVADMMETSPGSQHEPGKLSDDQCWSIIKQKVSKSETLNVEVSSATDGASHIRHLNLISCEDVDVESIFRDVDARKLRTVFSMVDVFNRPRKFKSLRTLKLRSSGITELPDSICKLRHLRYLDVSDTAIKALPEFITELYHLETLQLKNCSECRQLSTLGCLPRLKILEIGGMGIVKCIDNEFFSSSDRARVFFPALKELALWDMGGLEEWMISDEEGDQVFPCLEKLSIEGCDKLKSISICGLSSLVEFGIERCDELRYLSGEFHGFTSLQLLRIKNCEKLESIPSVPHCTSLVELNIWYCCELITIPGDFQELKSSLKTLMIRNCKLGALPSGLQCCTSLEELVIWNWGELIHINDLQELSSLRRLSIYGCEKLISIDWLGLRQLRSLVELTIMECRSLSDFPEEDCMGSLTQLRELDIGDFSKELEAFPAGLVHSFQHPNLSGSLESLEIYGWDKLKSIPHQLQYLTALKALVIYGFDGEEFEEALPDWLANLSSLRHLEIVCCENLKHLPSSIAIQHLSKLETLEIWGCPLLRKNCRKENNGCEWPKISHIPTIKLH
ncbi:hypothetical protein SADUNF_Sadunf13G0106700 [Salix dunnii]|uniref:AAA+ ATPase domain-containing protein n=1 Tax=Salix dunnii TaxID=1413687 RepID=A0A835JLK8_9ROSI|nr:hypothetical protein SADUNF_Sadunf13G0106700 [Salix dunnii]